MKFTPTAAMEVLLDLTPLDLLIMAEARMALYRLQILKQPAVPKSAAGLLSIWKNVRDPILDIQTGYTIPVYHYSKIFNVMIDWDYWRNKNPVFPEDALIWFTDGSRAGSGTGSSIFGLRPNRSFSIPLGKFATVLQHIICYCKALARQRYNVFGRLTAEPKDISTTSIKDLCLFISGTGLMNLC
jgi:hypothetical protein